MQDQDIKIGWHAIVAGDGNGYGMIANQFYESFMRCGAHMIGHDEFGWDVAVCVTPPRSVLVGREKHREDLIFHTMFEASPMPEHWPSLLNKIGLIWVPSDWVKELFIANGVTTPIFKVGYAVDKNIYVPQKRVLRDDPFRVLIWGDSLSSRKNVTEAIKTFLRADLPNAECYVKVSDGIAPKGTISYNGVPKPNVHVNSESWNRFELVQWLQSGDVGMYLSGGEGYGLMPQEAMATGLPMIVANNTGMQEYVNPGNAMLVDCPTIERCETMSQVFNAEFFTAKPDYDMAVDLLRYAYHNREKIYDLGMKASAEVTISTWDDKALEALYYIHDYAESLK